MSQKTKMAKGALVEDSRRENRVRRFSTIISIFALVVSGLSFWEARQTRLLNETAALPALSATVDLIEPLAAAKPILAKIVVENLGRTTAKQINPLVKYAFSKADVPLVIDYSDGSMPASVISDLPPGAHTTLLNVNPANLVHDHDVQAVTSGAYNLYIYGKIPYHDVIGGEHEFHFCRLYRQVPGGEPLKLSYCATYNEAH